MSKRRLGPILSHLPALREKTYRVVNTVSTESNKEKRVTGSPGCPFAVSETEGFLKREVLGHLPELGGGWRGK